MYILSPVWHEFNKGLAILRQINQVIYTYVCTVMKCYILLEFPLEALTLKLSGITIGFHEQALLQHLTVLLEYIDQLMHY